jgi:hypothetical protein
VRFKLPADDIDRELEKKIPGLRQRVKDGKSLLQEMYYLHESQGVPLRTVAKRFSMSSFQAKRILDLYK